MKFYKIKKLIKGYRVSPDLKHLTLVGIPFKYGGIRIKIQYEKEIMEISRDNPLLGSKNFKDQFGRNREYTLYYYEWKPRDNQYNLF
tara:strand:- start:445 stop:705 length:261 start_codon:yes stop_codon:yes gene_type:complete